jgi:hypothetical protein
MLEKLRLGDSLGRHDRVLWLDADVLVRPDCPDLFALVPPTHWAALDQAAFCDEGFLHLCHRHMAEVCREEGLPVPDTRGRCFCAGVQLVPSSFAWLYAPRRRPSAHPWAEQSLVNVRLFLRPWSAVFSLPECFGRLAYWPLPRRHLDMTFLMHYAGPPSPEARLADMRRDRDAWLGHFGG